MNNFKLTDNTTLEILNGASLDNITIVTDTFTELGFIAEALVKKDNLKTVQFLTDTEVTGEYSDMVLEYPLFKFVDFNVDKKVIASISMREKTDIEKRLDALEDGQGLQDGAIADLGDVVSTIAEGGTI